MLVHVLPAIASTRAPRKYKHSSSWMPLRSSALQTSSSSCRWCCTCLPARHDRDRWPCMCHLLWRCIAAAPAYSWMQVLVVLAYLCPVAREAMDLDSLLARQQPQHIAATAGEATSTLGREEQHVKLRLGNQWKLQATEGGELLLHCGPLFSVVDDVCNQSVHLAPRGAGAAHAPSATSAMLPSVPMHDEVSVILFLLLHAMPMACILYRPLPGQDIGGTPMACTCDRMCRR